MLTGNCSVAVYDTEKLPHINREFELPEHLEPVNILAIGYSNAGTADTSRFDRQRIALSQLVTYEK